jgi:hypothetical protein
MMTSTKVVGVEQGDIGEVAKKEWRSPALRKLPIAATAGASTQAKHLPGDEHGGKTGESNIVS